MIAVFVVSISTGYILVGAQAVSDGFLNMDYVAETWRTTVDTNEGKVTLEEKSCNEDNWYCGSTLDVCLNDLDDGEYIAVAKEDVSTSTYKWKISNTSCETPQCESDNLVADNLLNFTEYPARDACKAVGGRLPTNSELECIYNNKNAFGDNFEDAYYWSATESFSSGARRVRFSDGDTRNGGKDNSNYVRCVRGW